MSRAFYNEIDPYCARWLRRLISAGHIADGVVDERSIEDITPDELKPFTQVHFFAGIGGWSLALRQAGWPDGVPVWTGSCPCQPFSQAGAGAGFDDERHLWPAFHYLIEQSRPAIVIGEQVASKDALQWLDLVFDDLEGTGYSTAAADLCAASVGAPHIRQRLWWVADTNGRNACAERQQRGRQQRLQQKDGTSNPLANSNGIRRSRISGHRETGVAEYSQASSVADDDDAGSQARQCETILGARWWDQGGTTGERRGASTPWSDIEWIVCTDGKARATQSCLQPLAHGVSNRVGRLRAYGNAIVPEVGAAFINAYLDTRGRDIVTYGSSVWQLGANAARAGKPASACPYSPESYDFVTWFNGWSFARHQMAKEDLEEL